MLIWILFDFRFFEKQLFYLLTFQNVIFFNSEYYTANLRKQDTRLWFLWKDSWDFFTATLRLLSPSGFWKGLGAVDMDKSGLEMVVLRMMFVVVKTFLLYGPENFHSYEHWLAERYACKTNPFLFSTPAFLYSFSFQQIAFTGRMCFKVYLLALSFDSKLWFIYFYIIWMKFSVLLPHSNYMAVPPLGCIV